MKDLQKRYDPSELNDLAHLRWKMNEVYKWNEGENKSNNFIIDTPPPTVSGMLHMGHISSYCHTDFIARYKRMTGKNVFYPMGFDDNGLPTERLVEKNSKTRASDLTRENFTKLCKDTSEEYRKQFRELFTKMGLSIDWEQEYHTVSDISRKLSQLSFIDLYNKNETYRTIQPMFWDTVDQTAIAQAEIVETEFSSYMNYINFTLECGKKIVIATTRPELLAACVCVFFHPDDERFKHLEGQYAKTPLFKVCVPLIPDTDVKMDKGSGLVMCCTFGDEMDIKWAKKHNLSHHMIINKYGKLSDFSAVRKLSEHSTENLEKIINILHNLKIKAAREESIKLLEEYGEMHHKDQIIHNVKCAERSGSPIEIFPTPQWFIHILKHKKQLLDNANKIAWYPKHMKNRIIQWIEGLEWDWCVSRQRYFGVPFPIWYSNRHGEEGKILVANVDQLPVDPLYDLPEGYSRNEITAETDVMDTWATSSVSPQLNSYAITDNLSIDKDRHKSLFPADLRPQSHEIIRTWTFYTIVKSLLHENKIPWKNTMISGWCLAKDKTKMSKSKGNVITPKSIIDKYGADAIRYWTSSSKLGTDTVYSEDVIKIGHRLITKIWNASKFVAMHIQNIGQNFDIKAITETMDLWILSKLSQTIKECTVALENYEYCQARVVVEDFFWNVFCDNYIEFIKSRVYNLENETASSSAQHGLAVILNNTLKLFAPFLPHVTDILYYSIFDSKKSIHSRNTWPDYNIITHDKNSEKIGDASVILLNEIRKIRTDHNLSMKHAIKQITIGCKTGYFTESALSDFKSVTNAENLIIQNTNSVVPEILSTDI